MIQLTTNLSEPLLELLARDGALVDGVEVGPWFSPQQIAGFRRALPRMPFYFHGSGLIERVGLVPGATPGIRRYLHATCSPWVSMHLTMWLPGMVSLMLRRGWRMPRPDPERAAWRLVRQVRRLGRSVDVPILLENMAPLPFDGYDFEVQVERIAGVLDRTGCGLLLDMAHARVSAATLRLDVADYLGGLPLERAVQIHVSGPRLRDGRLVDAHEPLQEVDYTLLEWLLARAHPQVVTLEYIRDRDALGHQLLRLRDILAAHRGPS